MHVITALFPSRNTLAFLREMLVASIRNFAPRPRMRSKKRAKMKAKAGAYVLLHRYYYMSHCRPDFNQKTLKIMSQC